MQRYTEQLIEDIQEAKKRPRPLKPELSPELEMFRYAEEYLHGELYEMGELFGLEKIQFPPSKKLNTEQIKSIVKNLTELWVAFNFIPDFPEELPEVNKYNLLVDYLEHKTTFVSEGHTHFEFCTYDPNSCPFPKEFCSCKDFEDDDIDMDSFDYNKNELPF